MAVNYGKRFEEDIKRSVPENCWIYRLRDSSGAWKGGEHTRFTPSNICDYIIMADKKMFLLELKSHTGASIPFSCIRPTQIEEMSKIEHDDIEAYFLLNYRDIERTYAIKAKDLKAYMESTDRKSIPIKWCINNAIEVPSEKKRTRFRYSLEVLLEGDVNGQL